jgi:diguanylate cyclase (GGDEF)-like protein
LLTDVIIVSFFMPANVARPFSIPTRYAGEKILNLAKTVLETAFQPIAETTTGAVFGNEALLRGHDKLGFADPIAIFDRMAETDHLLAFDNLLRARALSKFASVPDYRSKTLFLNLDSRLIKQGTVLLECLMTQLRTYGVAPSSICFELSERFDNAADPAFGPLITCMRRAGLKVAIDDFGAGQSEFKLLCDYPVDYLKIDRHFITGLADAPRKQHLVRNIVNIAHTLGIRVVAEGVETEPEFRSCRELGVDMVQGWYIARPSVNIEDQKTSYPHLKEQTRTGTRAISLDELLIRKEIEHLPGVYENDSIEKVFEMFRLNPGSSYFPVLNVNNEPRGIIQEAQLKEYIYHPFGRDLLKNRDYLRPVSHFAKTAPIISLDSDTGDLVSAFANMEGRHCVLLTENMRYAGTISAASLIRILNEKQIKTAQDQNPLTGLPGNLAIVDYLKNACLDGDAGRYFCYCDFDNFKPFNDRYGFHAGDHAILLFAAMLRRYFFQDGEFIGHIGGDDFFVGLQGATEEELLHPIGRLLNDFAAEVSTLYSEAERAAGAIAGQGRDGVERLIPLMRCSIGIVELPEGMVVSDINRISAEIAQIKKRAKESSTGLAMVRVGGL